MAVYGRDELCRRQICALTAQDRITACRAPQLPDDSFDYDDFVGREFGGKKSQRLKTHGVRWHWWVVALVLAALFMFGFLLFRR